MNSIYKLAAKNSLIFSMGNASQRLIGFVLIPLYTKYFSLEDYGKIGLLEITATFLLTILGLGLFRAFNRWYWDKKYSDKQKSLFFTVLVFLTLVGTVFYISIIYFQSYISLLLFDSIDYGYVLNLMTLSAILQTIAQLIAALMRLQQKALIYSVSQTTKLIISLIITVILIVKFNANIEAIYEAQVIGFIIYFILLSRYIYGNIKFSFDLIILKEMFYYSLPLMLAAISGIIFSIADRYLIKFLLGLRELGIYTLGYKIANSIRVFLINSIQMAIMPIQYQIIDEKNNKVVYVNILTYFSIIVIFSSIYVPSFPVNSPTAVGIRIGRTILA